MDPDLRGVLEGLRGCCWNQLAPRTLHPPEDLESENQPGSPLVWSAAVSVSWWRSLPAPLSASSQALGQGSHCSPRGAVGESGNASLFLWEEVLKAPLRVAALAFAPSVLPRHPGSRKGLSPWTLRSGVSRSVALRLKAVSADGSLRLAGAQPISLTPRACPASPLPLLPVIATSFSELPYTLPPRDRGLAAQSGRLFSPAVGGLTSC